MLILKIDMLFQTPQDDSNRYVKKSSHHPFQSLGYSYMLILKIDILVQAPQANSNLCVQSFSYHPF